MINQSSNRADRAARARRKLAHIRRAFTLIELMAVLAIIGIMTAMIIPEMRGSFDDALLRTSAREIISVCNLASSRAIAANVPHRVRLDSRTGKYFVEKQTRRGMGEGGFTPLRDLPGGEGAIDRRVSLLVRDPLAGAPGESTAAEPTGESSNEEPSDAIKFYSDGTADAREVLLQDRDGFRMALRINPVTAHVTAVEMERK